MIHCVSVADDVAVIVLSAYSGLVSAAAAAASFIANIGPAMLSRSRL